jgi:hypothetical protein
MREIKSSFVIGSVVWMFLRLLGTLAHFNLAEI